MTEKLDKYILDVQIDNETGEEHCTILKTDRTTNMDDWITIISAMYTHHSVFEPLIKELNKLSEENEELKKELSEYKDFVLSDDKILCYTCLFCTHKGIYEVDCDVKGHVDVHGSCLSYTKKELQ